MLLNLKNVPKFPEFGRGLTNLNIKLKPYILGDKIYTNLHMNKNDEPVDNNTMKYLHFLQIPIGLAIIGAVYMAWRCIKARRIQEDTKE